MLAKILLKIRRENLQKITHSFQGSNNERKLAFHIKLIGTKKTMKYQIHIAEAGQI